MSGGFDITAFIPKFVDENKDRIEKLNQAVLALEKNPSDLGLLKEIMRDVHTLKGTARMMGFGDIVALSHKTEDIFVKIKDGGLQPTKVLYDLVFRALDTIANMVEVKLKDANAVVNATEICGQLEAVLGAAGLQSMKELTQIEVDKVLSDEAGSQGIKTETPSPASSSPGDISTPSHLQSKVSTKDTVGKEGESPAGLSVDNGELKEDAGEEKSIQTGKKTIRIGLDKIDVLYNYLVELIMAQMAFRQRYEDVMKLNLRVRQFGVMKTGQDVKVGLREWDRKKTDETIMQYDTVEKYVLEEISRYSEVYETNVVKLEAITEGIRHQVMSMRMQPVSAIFDIAARLVRDLSRQFRKEADLVTSGGEVELDNNIIEILKDPLVHLLRNAVDHGLEEPATRISHGKKRAGTIALSAKQEGGDVLITVEDDGKGIDKELVKETAVRKGLLRVEKANELSDEEIYGLIMKPGFTTSKIVTDTSGRGVGMDVVKTVVDRLNGSLVVESNKGWGTRFVLKVPATIALMNVLIIRVENMTVAIPSTSIERITHVSRQEIRTLEGKASVFMEDKTIPLVNMAAVFMLENTMENGSEGVPVIISQSGGKKVGFIVSEFLYEKEVVFREFKGYLTRPRYFSGVTTLGTGEVIPILNIQELIKTKDMTTIFPGSQVPKVEKQKTKRNVVLVVEDSMITAELEKNILMNAGYEVDIAIDGIDAMDKLQRKKYDILVTDVDMPGMNGFELTAKVRMNKKLKDIPVIVVTARETDEDKRKGIEAGADAYILKKEFDQSSLLNTMKKLIGE